MCSFGGYVSFNNSRKHFLYFIIWTLQTNKIKFQQWFSHYIVDKYHLFQEEIQGSFLCNEAMSVKEEKLKAIPK